MMAKSSQYQYDNNNTSTSMHSKLPLLALTGLDLKQSQAKFLVLSRNFSLYFHIQQSFMVSNVNVGYAYLLCKIYKVSLCDYVDLDLIKFKIRLGDFVFETGSDPQTVLGLFCFGFSLVLLLKFHRSWSSCFFKIPFWLP